MGKNLEFPDLLRLIDERSAAFRAAVASAPSLDVQVPACPEWTLFDLVQHLGEGRRSWAATVAAGPAAAKSAPQGAPGARGPVPPRGGGWPGAARSTRRSAGLRRPARPPRAAGDG
ncbi:maleylpyruvate isomerase N-terminal domain-containing protein [Streptomyces avermitilis]|uniref:maleylpyruvate isomerase N-terminal domain-containing protein n=1 Tax=Streptomyces avermitilis TaxID=33903 RepID=UPI003F4BA481